MCRRRWSLGSGLGADVVLYQAHLAEGLILEADAPEEARASFEQAVEHLERLRARARADDLKLGGGGPGREPVRADRAAAAGAGAGVLRTARRISAREQRPAGRVPLA